ncbi:MAG: dihydroorotase [Rhodothermales bacterium]|nr:dihydroorotase [Rhodothermales bacterium]MBO6780880.1 dihydroorotase [Rhodothermales bacterium]
MTQPDLLIRGGTLLNPETGRETRADVLIRQGRIAQIGTDIDAEGVEVYDATGRYVSPGWMDMHVHLREPGQEHKETIANGCKAAAFGGFTAVACMPNTEPAIHTRDVVEFIIERGNATPVDVHPIAAVSMDRAGKKLTEMGDLADGGAVAFSDDGSPVWDAGMMRTALEYSAMLGKPVINHEEDLTLNPHGHMHEGEVSVRLGLPGIPGLAEEVMIARDILIAEATGGHVHVAHISTARAVELVRDGKARGINVTTEVCAHHFTLTDESVATSEYDTHYKMHPPLRTAADVEAMKEGLRDGTIDAICTDHAPHASFEKEVEFIAAPFGILGLETAWGLTGRELIEPGVLSTAEAVRKLTIEPRRILGLEQPVIEEGAQANLTIFDDSSEWTFEAGHIKSKSRNTPFVGAAMKGRAWAIYNRGRLVRNEA